MQSHYLKRAASEDVRASSDLVTIALSDREFKKFYENDVKFKNYFDKQSYPSEIAQFLKFILIRFQIPGLTYYIYLIN